MQQEAVVDRHSTSEQPGKYGLKIETSIKEEDFMQSGETFGIKIPPN